MLTTCRLPWLQAWLDAVSGAIATASVRDDMLSLASCRFANRLRLMSQLGCLCSADNATQAAQCVGPSTFEAPAAPARDAQGQ